MTVVSFDRVAHLIRVPVRLGDSHDDQELHFLVDTGSECLILDSRFMAECGLEVGTGVTARDGVDETGHVRYDATLAGAVHLKAAPETAQDAPKVIFQEIIHDGLVGSEFLYRYRVSVDLAGARLVLAPLSEPPAS